MTDSLESVLHTMEGAEPAVARREWELRERVADLQSELAERIERERIRELELASQRHELEVRFAYNATLEERVLENRNEVVWLHTQFEAQVQGFRAEQQRVADELAAERALIAAERAAERDRIENELAAVRERAEAAQQTLEEIQCERDAVRSELDAERRRVSYRVVQRVATRVRKHRVVFAIVRRTARILGR